jgi:hypothetical protein
MLYRVSRAEFGSALRKRQSETQALRPPPLHTEAFTESGSVLAVMLTLALVAECVIRVTGLS